VRAAPLTAEELADLEALAHTEVVRDAEVARLKTEREAWAPLVKAVEAWAQIDLDASAEDQIAADLTLCDAWDRYAEALRAAGGDGGGQ
jgi:hypothetical protein